VAEKRSLVRVELLKAVQAGDGPLVLKGTEGVVVRFGKFVDDVQYLEVHFESVLFPDEDDVRVRRATVPVPAGHLLYFGVRDSRPGETHDE
jgi:hypothetical protein